MYAPMVRDAGRRRSWYVGAVDEDEALARAMRVLQETTAGAAGPGFYSALAGGLARAFDMEFAMVAEIDPGEPGRARPLAFWSGRALGSCDSYALEGTPCADVFAGRACQFSSGVQALYPGDRLFVELGIESYAGIPVRTQTGEVIGLITVYDRSPRPRLQHFEAILTAFAVRVGWNLQRERLELGLRQVVARANALTRIATRLHTAHARPDEAFQEMCAEVRAVLGISAVSVALLRQLRLHVPPIKLYSHDEARAVIKQGPKECVGKHFPLEEFRHRIAEQCRK